MLVNEETYDAWDTAAKAADLRLDVRPFAEAVTRPGKPTWACLECVGTPGVWRLTVQVGEEDGYLCGPQVWGEATVESQLPERAIKVGPKNWEFPDLGGVGQLAPQMVQLFTDADLLLRQADWQRVGNWTSIQGEFEALVVKVEAR